jgi:hypothetical protein
MGLEAGTLEEAGGEGSRICVVADDQDGATVGNQSSTPAERVSPAIDCKPTGHGGRLGCSILGPFA